MACDQEGYRIRSEAGPQREGKGAQQFQWLEADPVAQGG